MPRIDPTCPICAEEDLRTIVDSQLWNGHSPREVAQELDRGPEFAALAKYHLFNLHVREPTRDNYTLHLITYLQDARRTEQRELQKSSDRQKPSVLDRTDKAKRWTMEQIAKFEGFYDQKSRRGLAGESQKLLEAVQSADPGIIQRIEANARRQEPVEVTATETSES